MAAKKDQEREDRIHEEIVVDAHDSEERAMGWYYYLQEQLRFPFIARCVARRATSPLKVGTRVEVTDMAPLDERGQEMFVMIHWETDRLAVPLAQLQPGDGVDDDTRQAVEDWSYWVEKGYEF